MIVVLKTTEDRMIVSSFIWTKHQNVTDGRTDRQRSAFPAMRTRCKDQ